MVTRNPRWVFSRLQQFLALGWIALAGCSSPAQRPPRPKFRHLVLVSIDTLRADYLTVYGHPGYLSPHLDRLARQGLLAARYYAAVPTTLASHTTMFTGLYPHRHGVPRNGFLVSGDLETLGTVLRDGGFSTAAFVSAVAVARKTGLGNGFHVYDEPTGGLVFRSGEQTVDNALSWLRGSKEEPIFLFVHLFEPHWPYRPPPPLDQVLGPSPSQFDGTMKAIKRLRKRMQRGRAGRHEIQRLKELYGGEVMEADRQLGRLVDGLAELGFLDSALLVIVADHGENLDDHAPHFINHGPDVYDATVHIPLILHAPGGLASGRIFASQVGEVDLAPTLLSFMGFEFQTSVDGRDRADGFLAGWSLVADSPLFAEATKPWEKVESGVNWLNENKAHSVRTSRYKYVLTPWKRQKEFYHLHADPSEKNNLLDSGSAIAPMKKLRELLLAQQQRRRTFSSEFHTIDAEHKAQLEALGYVGDN